MKIFLWRMYLLFGFVFNLFFNLFLICCSSTLRLAWSSLIIRLIFVFSGTNPFFFFRSDNVCNAKTAFIVALFHSFINCLISYVLKLYGELSLWSRVLILPQVFFVTNFCTHYITHCTFFLYCSVVFYFSNLQAATFVISWK